ncbi:MAG: hypothetical protein GEU93_01430 [Propionibacteriales bacterium]|nr:hypothetical protein [Propionibacteriales bacterium]
MSHLGDRIAALVDGQLDYPARERALAHLERCDRCRCAVEEERRAKTTVQAMPSPEPSAALLVTLTRNPPPYGMRPPPRRDVLHAGVRQTGLVVAGAGSVSAGVLALAYVLGAGSAEPEPQQVSPPVGEFTSEFAGFQEPMPFIDPAFDAHNVSSLRPGTR